MDYGAAAWGLRGESLASQLGMVRGLGLQLLELSIANQATDVLQPDASERDIDDVKALFRQAGVRLECACTGNDFTGEDVPVQIEKVCKVIDISHRLGVRYLRIFAGFASDSLVFGERLDRMLGALRRCQAYASARQLCLAVETHGGVRAMGDGLSFYYHSATTRLDFWPDLFRTGVSCAYDPANLSAVGSGGVVAFYERFSHRIPYVHLKDFRTVGSGKVPVACGEGDLDWPHLMQALAGFTGPALIEYENPGDVEDGLSRSLDFLRGLRTSHEMGAWREDRRRLSC